jgi:hypothetical protein
MRVCACVCVCVCTIGTIAIRLLTLITTGLAQRLRTDTTTATQQLQLDALNNQLEVADSVQFKIVAPLTLTVCDPSMLDFRESYLREAIVLLLRTITQCFPELLGVKSIQVGNLIFSPPKITQSSCLFFNENVYSYVFLQHQMLLALLYMQAQCPGEADIVCTAARRYALIWKAQQFTSHINVCCFLCVPHVVSCIDTVSPWKLSSPCGCLTPT